MTRRNSSDEPRKPRGDYLVGYAKPPVEHRWKPGQSRRRGGTKKKPATIADTLKAKLMIRIPVERDGRRRYMTMQDLILEQLVRDAAKVDAKARSQLFSLYARYGNTDETVIDPGLLSHDDQDLIDAYLANAGQGASMDGTGDPDAADMKDDAAASPRPLSDGLEES